MNIQCDGDLNYAPGVLWTAAHHKIPLLTVMHNNRAYHMERMYITHDGGAGDARRQPRRTSATSWPSRSSIYVALAKAYGVFGVGPIENPNDLGPAIKRALEVVKRGEPALVDVITQGR